ncbi:sugar transporter SWEET1 [Lingula anatina]|uniref:Sugar transporter SWEET n=1 Tax=Lingula anatina TaxID=7574 RepID=A0A1S3IUV1_LINAN|nr:sugar transporter SWEET1 [Lingula anatina]|eukprot:XP_013401319.1 sugar transporter SWEET1 [Lingula anatina]
MLVAWLVAICTFVLFLTGALTCWKIMKTRSTQDCAFLPMLAVYVNTLSWMFYGKLTNDRLMVAVYIWGLICQSVYITVYYIYTHSTDLVQKQILSTVIVCLLAWTYYRHYAITLKLQVFYSGSACVATSILADASPFISMMEVITSKSTACLSSFSQSCLSLLVSLEWLLYGILAEDMALQITYLIGVILNGTLAGLYFIYPKEKVSTEQELYHRDNRDSNSNT